jgi:diadenosine tetraphosphate (Ap4A) HIT family hydrolase
MQENKKLINTKLNLFIMLKRGCSKCDLLANGEFFFENDSVVAYFSRFDFKGHSVILLKDHKERVTEMNQKESHDFIDAMTKIGKAIEAVIKPDIINYQFNMNWNKHVHAHIYPRFKKDDPAWGEPIKIPKKHANFKKRELSAKEKKKIIALVKK